MLDRKSKKMILRSALDDQIRALADGAHLTKVNTLSVHKVANPSKDSGIVFKF